MRGIPTHRQLTLIALVAALATVVFANLGMTLAAGVAAVVAVGFVAEAWRRND